MRVDKNNMVVEVAEKESYSNQAFRGIDYFKKGRVL